MTIKDAVKYYKDNIDKCWDDESYKWEAVKHYRDTWDIDAPDFAAMLETALSHANNLMSGPMYYPYKMIVIFAKQDPEKVRKMFKNLYDESLPLEQRIHDFRANISVLFEDHRKENAQNAKSKNTYQDLRAICVYLSFQYPEKYYLYKSQMYKNFRDNVGFIETSSEKNAWIRKYSNYSTLCDAVVEEIEKDEDLVMMQRERVESNPDFYKDPALHLLAQTVVYINANSDGSNGLDEYYPKDEDYPVDLTKEDWRRFLEEVEYPNHKGSMRVLKCYLDIGGEASPAKMSNRYKGHAMVYISSVVNTSKRALKYFNMDPCPDGEDSVCVFPIAFYGKHGTGEDKGFYVYRMRDELKAALQEMDLSDIELEYKEEKNDMSESGFGLNTILYGPPGTGKTFNTMAYAVAIIEGKTYEDVQAEAAESYSEVRKRYDSYAEAGQIAFTTFHQSYGYEDFIEGIKPVVEEESQNVSYSVESGVFKRFCENAQEKIDMRENFDSAWEKLMQSATAKDGYTFYRRSGKALETKVDPELDKFFIPRPNSENRITKDSVYKYWTTDPLERERYYGNSTGGKWLKNVREAVVDELQKNYGLAEYSPSVDTAKRFVFIIDEINRGNISKIFGELITLIEDSKRKGSIEEACAILPYSKEEFSVPDNVYILGTMNTADRSIALMDTALRRRFNFVEMMPDTKVIEGITVSEDDKTLDVAKMLEAINKRIEYLYDREHTIGHAFFTRLWNDNSMDCLASIFKNKVVPLLQEYFYEDYEKIQMVLGDNDKSSDAYKFILDKKVKETDIFKKSPQLDLHEKSYEIQEDAFKNIQSYIEITEIFKAEE